jgi:hypothetical protein
MTIADILTHIPTPIIIQAIPQTIMAMLMYLSQPLLIYLSLPLKLTLLMSQTLLQQILLTHHRAIIMDQITTLMLTQPQQFQPHHTQPIHTAPMINRNSTRLLPRMLLEILLISLIYMTELSVTRDLL